MICMQNIVANNAAGKHEPVAETRGLTNPFEKFTYTAYSTTTSTKLSNWTVI
jgi:hypothetical protein